MLWNMIGMSIMNTRNMIQLRVDPRCVCKMKKDSASSVCIFQGQIYVRMSPEGPKICLTFYAK